MRSNQTASLRRSARSTRLSRFINLIIVALLLVACGESSGAGSTRPGGATGGVTTGGGGTTGSQGSTSDTGGQGSTGDTGTTGGQGAMGGQGTGGTGSGRSGDTDTGASNTTRAPAETLAVAEVLIDAKTHAGQTIKVTGEVLGVMATMAFTLTDSSSATTESTTMTTDTNELLVLAVYAGVGSGGAGTPGGGGSTSAGGTTGGGSTTDGGTSETALLQGLGCDIAAVLPALTSGMEHTGGGTTVITIDETLVAARVDVVGTLCTFDTDELSSTAGAVMDAGALELLSNRPILIAWSVQLTDSTSEEGANSMGTPSP